MLWAVVITAVLAATQVLIIAATIAHDIPLHLDPLANTIFFHYRKGILPERELELYALFLITGVAVFAVLMAFVRRRFTQDNFAAGLKSYNWVQGGCIAAEAFAVFHITIHQNPAWAWWMLKSLLVCSALITLFWKEVQLGLVALRGQTAVLPFVLFAICGVVLTGAGAWVHPQGNLAAFLDQERFFLFFAFLAMTGICLAVFLRGVLSPQVFQAKRPLKINEDVKIIVLSLSWAVQALLVVNRMTSVSFLEGYGIFIFVSIAFALLIKRFALRLSGRFHPWGSYVLAEALITALLFAAYFQAAVHSNNPWMAQRAMDVLLVIMVVVKCAWPYLVRIVRKVYSNLIGLQSRPEFITATNLGALLFIALVIYTPDPEAVAAWFFMGDYFHNWDLHFMGGVYGMFHGILPDVDISTSYGFGFPVFMYWGMKALGGFDYNHVILVFVFIGIVYYGLWYLLLRRLLNSRVLAFAAIVLGMRAQMFLSIVVPMVWNEAQCSVYRYCFDIGFFWMLFLYLQSQRRWFLLGMAAFAALGIYHMSSTGMVLYMALILCAGLEMGRAFLQEKHWPPSARVLVFSVAVVPLLLFALIYATVGRHSFEPAFWQNVFEFTSYFTKGFFYAPIFSALMGKEFIKVAVGLLFPMFYLGTALYTGWRFLSGERRPKEIFICILAVYGAGLFSYYVGMSHKYYSVGLPAIFIVFYWLDEAMTFFNGRTQRCIKGAAIGICLYALLTTQLFMSYPNLLNWSRNPIVDEHVAQKVGHNSYYFHQMSIDFPPWLKVPLNSLGEADEQFKFEKDFPDHAALKEYYRQETAFREDADLIKSLTPEGARVPLLSSFEVMILSKTDRKPFFYYFPLLNSHPMRMRNFVVTTIFSYPQLTRCLQELEREKPPYIFMERVFLTPQVPMWYGEQFEDLIGLIRYVLNYYEPAETGKFLVAMKRKQNP